MIKKKKKWSAFALCVMGLALVYGNSKRARFTGRAPDSQNTLRLTIHLPFSSRNYRIRKADSLVSNNWQEIAHAESPDGTFIITNLSHSATTTNGEAVIYVHLDEDQGFFRADYDPE